MNLAPILLKTEPAHPLFDAVAKFPYIHIALQFAQNRELGLEWDLT